VAAYVRTYDSPSWQQHPGSGFFQLPLHCADLGLELKACKVRPIICNQQLDPEGVLGHNLGLLLFLVPGCMSMGTCLPPAGVLLLLVVALERMVGAWNGRVIK
jgi:hypothetical protein